MVTGVGAVADLCVILVLETVELLLDPSGVGVVEMLLVLGVLLQLHLVALLIFPPELRVVPQFGVDRLVFGRSIKGK
jgi:hypothetical protein